jgi:hypothetical protein
MTIEEKFKSDQEYNSRNELFVPYDDEFLGKRIPGGYIKFGDGDVRLVFDNGHNYFIKEGRIQEEESIPANMLLYKYIQKCLYDLIVNNSDEKSPRIMYTTTYVETPSDTPLLIVKVVVHHHNRTVCVSIFHAMHRGDGYGFKFLAELYKICKKFGYKLQLTEMVQGFYHYMVDKRCAKEIVFEDIVEITDNTDLVYPRNKV